MPLSPHWPSFVNRFSHLPDVFFSRTLPTPFERPVAMHYNDACAAEIGLPPHLEGQMEYLGWFTGRIPLPGGETIASVYAGHQFGHYVPQLGDGRAHLLGQIEHQGKLWELQLKGSGVTPYSRFGDGKAVWRSSIREYLCSEGVHRLGLPTTRALTLIGSDEPVKRETWERAAMVTRVAPSFIRFGHFEYFANTQRDPAAVAALADFVMRHHFSDIPTGGYAAWIEDVVRRTAAMIAGWQAVGFAHGVMNTDNMSILGLTLDYGPFGFMEAYDPGYVCNHSDHDGRYAFERQPGIGLWNLHALAFALGSLIPAEQAKTALAAYWPAFSEKYLARMREKLGLTTEENDDALLIRDLLATMQAAKADYTLTFRALCRCAAGDTESLRPLLGEAGASWLRRYEARLGREMLAASERHAIMDRVNPNYVLRNWIAEKAIRRAEDHDDFNEIDRVFRMLKRPFDTQGDNEEYAHPAPFDASEICVSCSS